MGQRGVVRVVFPASPERATLHNVGYRRNTGVAGECLPPLCSPTEPPPTPWHDAQATLRPHRVDDQLIKHIKIERIKRGVFGMTNFSNRRIRVLLYAGHPDWSKLATLTL